MIRFEQPPEKSLRQRLSHALSNKRLSEEDKQNLRLLHGYLLLWEAVLEQALVDLGE